MQIHPKLRPVSRIAPEGVPFVAAGAAFTGATAFVSPKWAVLPLLLTATTAAFFRDPHRPLPTDERCFYSAADGQVLRVDEVHEPRFIGGRALRIATFLSLLDVHINRTPTTGTVRYIEHVPGGFRAAWDNDADTANERNYIGLETAYGPVLIVQIAGLVARRIVCRVGPTDTVQAGEQVGLIKFGSRTDVLVPADRARPLITAGRQVYAGETPLGAWR
jgi:phosphatidylserine decarboxylase